MRTRHLALAVLVSLAALTACGDDPGAPEPPDELIEGWTDFSAQPGALVIHVSSSGDDAAPGTASAPKRTIAAGLAMLRDGEPDWLLLRRGDTFVLPAPLTWNRTGPAAGVEGWMRLGAYGNEEDPRPVIDTGDQGGILLNPGFQSTKQIRKVAFSDIHLRASTRINAPASAMTAPPGVQVIASQFQGTGAAFSRLLFENVMIQGYGLGFNASAIALEHPTIRRSIFHYIFTPDGAVGGAQGWIGAPNGAILEDNVFYQIQSDDIPGVVTSAYSEFLHSAYIPAEATDIHTHGNIVVKATEALMQRAGGTYSRNVGVNCRVGGVLGQTWGVTPTPGGVNVLFEESLILNAFEQPFFLGNTASGTVRENLIIRDRDGAVDVNLNLVPRNAAGSGENIGVHAAAFTGNVLSGRVIWQPNDASSFTGLTFNGNQEQVGIVDTDIGEYLASIGWSGSTADDWARRLIARDRSDFAADHLSTSIINFYRARFALAPLR
jgi:hypothetical protein